MNLMHRNKALTSMTRNRQITSISICLVYLDLFFSYNSIGYAESIKLNLSETAKQSISIGDWQLQGASSAHFQFTSLVFQNSDGMV